MNASRYSGDIACELAFGVVCEVAFEVVRERACELDDACTSLGCGGW